MYILKYLEHASLIILIIYTAQIVNLSYSSPVETFGLYAAMRRTYVYGNDQVGSVVGVRVESLKSALFLAIFRRIRKFATRDCWRRHLCSRVPSVRPHGTNLGGSHWMDDIENGNLVCLEKICRENSNFIKI